MFQETVRIVSEEHASMGGFKVINKSDFDEKVHKLFVETKAAPADPVDSMSEVDLRALLDGLNVEYDPNAKAPALRKLYRRATQPNT